MKNINFETCELSVLKDFIENLEFGELSEEGNITLKSAKIIYAQRIAIDNSQIGGLNINKNIMKEIDLSKIDYIELTTKISELQSRVINVGERALLMRYVHEKETRDSSITDVEFKEPIIKDSKTVLKRKVWNIEVLEMSDGTSEMNRTNDGFNINELMGLSSLLSYELLEQYKGHFKADIINRTVVVD